MLNNSHINKPGSTTTCSKNWTCTWPASLLWLLFITSASIQRTDLFFPLNRWFNGMRTTRTPAPFPDSCTVWIWPPRQHPPSTAVYHTLLQLTSESPHICLCVSLERSFFPSSEKIPLVRSLGCSLTGPVSTLAPFYPCVLISSLVGGYNDIWWLSSLPLPMTIISLKAETIIVYPPLISVSNSYKEETQ